MRAFNLLKTAATNVLFPTTTPAITENQQPRSQVKVEDEGIPGAGRQHVKRPKNDPKKPTEAQIQLLKDRIAKVTGNESFHFNQMSKTNISSVRRKCGMRPQTASIIWYMLLEQAKES